MSSGIQVHTESTEAFNNIHTKHMNKYCVFKIGVKDGESNESVMIDFKGEKSSTKTWKEEKDAFDCMKKAVVDLKEPRYIVYDFVFTSPSGHVVMKDCFIYWSPDQEASTKSKMVYAASIEYVKSAFQGLNKPVQVNDTDDFNALDILKTVSVKAYNDVKSNMASK